MFLAAQEGGIFFGGGRSAETVARRPAFDQRKNKVQTSQLSVLKG